MSDTPRKRVLIVAANPATSPVTGWPVGFWWAELTHPWWLFTEAGYDVEIASPSGGDLEGDGFSDPEHESGYSAHDILSLGFKRSDRHAGLLKGTRAVADLDPTAYDAVVVIGGQSPMVTMVDDTDLHRFFVAACEAGKIGAAVCHGTAILLRARLSTGDLLVKGKTWTGFSDAEEQSVDTFVGQRIQPFWIEEEARKIAETSFVTHSPFQPFAVRDGNLITGQQQMSGAATARLVVEALGR